VKDVSTFFGDFQVLYHHVECWNLREALMRAGVIDSDEYGEFDLAQEFKKYFAGAFSRGRRDLARKLIRAVHFPIAATGGEVDRCRQ
jgi:hypothetical protein